MILKELKVYNGMVEFTNCYIVQDEENKETIVIDPGGEFEKISAMLDILQAKVKYIYLTHCHGDHTGALKELKESTKGKILIHRYDADGLYNKAISLTDYIGIDEVHLEADSRVDDEDKIHVGNLEFIVLHTPGHTKGSTCLYLPQENLLFSGDTLFHGTWGRTDLPTGSFKDIIESIENKILILPDDTIVYPGHGKSTMIKEEQPIYYSLKPRTDF